MDAWSRRSAPPGKSSSGTWIAESLQELLTLEGEGLLFGSVAFSPNGDLLAAEDPAAANLVKLKCFFGMKMEEAAAALSLSLRNAERLWAYSKAWLHRELADDGK